MINTLDAYRDAGLKAGTAAKHGDWACHRFHKAWLSCALSLESDSDREAARREYDAGYSEGNPRREPIPFR